MKNITNLKLNTTSIAPNQTINEFLKLKLITVPIVDENRKPVGYATLTHIFGELIPKDIYMHSEAIGKTAGRLEFNHEEFMERFADNIISQHSIPLLAMVEHNDPIIKAVSLMLEYKIPLIAVTKNGEYIGFVNYEIVGEFLNNYYKK